MSKLAPSVFSKRIWTALFILIMLTLHLKIFTVAGFQVALSFFLIPLWVYTTFKIKQFTFKKTEFVLLLLILVLPFIPGNISSWGEFFKTYGQYVISYYLVVRVLSKPSVIQFKSIRKALLITQYILFCIVVLQFILVILLKQHQFYNLWGSQQLYYQLDIATAQYRMKGLYLEPSYLGLVTINIFWTRFYLSLENKIFRLNSNMIITLLILILTQSAFAYLAFFCIVSFEVFYNNLKKNNRLYGIGIIIFVIIILVTQIDKLLLLFRLGEILNSSSEIPTSGFMRVTLPLQIITQIFQEGHYLGITFGQLDSIAQNIMGEYGESGISNSFFLILAYFGILGFLILGVVIWLFFKVKNKTYKAFILLTLMNFNNSGAFMTIQFVFVTFLVPFLAIKYSNWKSNIFSSSEKNNLIHTEI